MSIAFFDDSFSRLFALARKWSRHFRTVQCTSLCLPLSLCALGIKINIFKRRRGYRPVSQIQFQNFKAVQELVGDIFDDLAGLNEKDSKEHEFFSSCVLRRIELAIGTQSYWLLRKRMKEKDPNTSINLIEPGLTFRYLLSQSVANKDGNEVRFTKMVRKELSSIDLVELSFSCWYWLEVVKFCLESHSLPSALSFSWCAVSCEPQNLDGWKNLLLVWTLANRSTNFQGVNTFLTPFRTVG